ncbi:hypothetical protein ABT261_40190, partial [Amycolatopsis sp. NPDC000740]
MRQVAAQPRFAALVADEHEGYQRHVLIRSAGEPALERWLDAPVPLAPSHLLVLVTPGALDEPSLLSSLPDLLAAPLASGGSIAAIWLGIRALAREPEKVRRLSEELKTTVVVPDGGFTVTPGAGLYAGLGAGGT